MFFRGQFPWDVLDVPVLPFDFEFYKRAVQWHDLEAERQIQAAIIVKLHKGGFQALPAQEQMMYRSLAQKVIDDAVAAKEAHP